MQPSNPPIFNHQLTFTDQMGNKIRLENFPKRIISLVPSQTELLFDLGLRDEVVGITKFCIHPVEMFRSKPRIGGTKKVNFDKIKELQPDLIIGNKEENEKKQIIELMKHYPVWMSDIKTLDDAYQMIVKVGEIVNKKIESVTIANNIKSKFECFESKKTNQNNDPKKVAYFIWNDPFMCAASDTFIDNMLSICGFKNVFASSYSPSKEELTRYPQIMAEQLKKANPDIILLSSEPYPFKEKHIANFKAICPDAKIEIVDGELFSWYGSRLLHAPEYFSNLLSSLNPQL